MADLNRRSFLKVVGTFLASVGLPAPLLRWSPQAKYVILNRGGELFISLHTGEPDGIDSEVSGDGYSRVSVSSGDFQWRDNEITSVTEITFPEARGDWGTITYIGVSAGRFAPVLVYAPIANRAIYLMAGDTVEVSELTFS